MDKKLSQVHPNLTYIGKIRWKRNEDVKNVGKLTVLKIVDLISRKKENSNFSRGFNFAHRLFSNFSRGFNFAQISHARN